MKARILQAIEEPGLELPAKINAALAANDRVKYYLSLLQMAALHARNPHEPAATMRRERIAAGVEDAWLDSVITETRCDGARYRIPECGALVGKIAHELRVMTEPVHETFALRLEKLLEGFPPIEDNLIDADSIDRMTRTGADGIHPFVMEVHKALNAAQMQIAEERIEGCAVYGVRKTDRPLIAAFMKGVNRTAPLKFHHPGLDTTATRTGARLVIENDLGTTDAHVVVIHVENHSVELTYTDVHPERIEFFQRMLKPSSTSWSENRSLRAESLAEGEPFYLITGRYECQDDADLRAYLEFLGSRLVFLIDWNRARKELRGFLRSRNRFDLLAWAAEQEIGHRGFLELGGARLIHTAIEETGNSAMHFGDRLCDVLGDEAAMEFVRFVLRSATDGLRQSQSPSLVHDRIAAELQAHFSSEEKRLFQLACDHAGLNFEIASLARDGIHAIGSPERDGKLARRAREYEHDADQLLVAVLEATRKRPEYSPLFQMIEAADDAADELEEVVFLFGLVADADRESLGALETLADLLVAGSQEWVKVLYHASQLERGARTSARGVAGDFLTAVDRVFMIEHQADDAQRALTYAAVEHAPDFRHLHVYAEMGTSLEGAADALKSAAVIARDYLLGSVLRR